MSLSLIVLSSAGRPIMLRCKLVYWNIFIISFIRLELFVNIGRLTDKQTFIINDNYKMINFF